MFLPELNEQCDRMLSSILLGKEFVIGRDNADDLFVVIGNDAVKIETWNQWIQLKYPHASAMSFEPCMMCNGTAQTTAIYGGTAFLCGYSDHGHVALEDCEYCQQGIALVEQNVKNIVGAYEYEEN